MYRTAFILAVIVAVASAFVTPANHAVSTKTYAPVTSQNMVVDADLVSNVASNAQLIAANSGDFGGYFFPVVGIGALSALILFLAPPLADE